MNISYIKVQDYLNFMEKTFLRIATGLLIGFFVCTTELNASPSFFQHTQLTEADQTATSESIRTSTQTPIEIALKNNVETPEERISIAFNQNVETESREVYTPLFKTMSHHLKNIPFQRITADVDDDRGSLEFLFLLGSGLLVSVSKTIEATDDDMAIVSFFYDRKLIFSNAINLSILPEHIISIEQKLQEV